MTKRSIYLGLLLLMTSVLIGPHSVRAVSSSQSIATSTSDTTPGAQTEIFFAPQSGTFISGSTFDVPLYINTKGLSVTTLEIHLTFDQNILSIENPSGGSSVIGVWKEAPSYDNLKGTVTLIGSVPKGLKTDSGLIADITFFAKSPGSVSVVVGDTSKVTLNDGRSSNATYEANHADYTIVPIPQGSIKVSSESHPFQDHWYNDSNPSFTWLQDPNVSGFSYVLDNIPNTIPGNTVISSSTAVSYQNIPDGISYFHIKAFKEGRFGSTTHYSLRIDTTPPADFTPAITFESDGAANHAWVNFSTTDSLSGIDHYEVGVIDQSKPASELPAFLRAESPYQIPTDNLTNSRVMIRAYDRAGNVRDVSILVNPPFDLSRFIHDHLVVLLGALLVLIIIGNIFQAFYGHHLTRHIRTFWKIFTNSKELEKIEEKIDEDTKPKPPAVILPPQDINKL